MSIKIIAENRKARHNYSILETFEAGLVLVGSEVKSLRKGQANLKDAYVAILGQELYLQNAHISEYSQSSYNNHEPLRKRKILLNKNEIFKIKQALTRKGLACVPLKMYFKKGLAKVEVALAKGKKLYDKRDKMSAKEARRQIQRRTQR